MAADGSVIIDISGDDSGFRRALGKLGTVTAAGMKAVTASIGAATAALGDFAVYAVKSGAEFEQVMAKASTLFGDVDVDMDGLKAKVLEVSNRTGVAAVDLGNSLYNALSAGIPATEDMAEATAFLEKSARLAKAGFTDIDTALSATAKTINAYGMGVEDTDKIQKVMIQTQNLGITTVGELGASLAQVTPTAAAFGVSFEQVGAALANMTAMGTPTAQATTQLNALIAELGKSGTVGAKGLEAAVEGTKYAGMGFKEMMDSGTTLNEVLDLMAAQAEKSDLSMVDMFSSIEAGKSAMAISGENSGRFASNLEAMATSADVVGEAYDKMANTLQSSTERIRISLQNLGVQIYEQNSGVIGEITAQFLDMATDLNSAFENGGFNGLAAQFAVALTEIVGMIATYAPAFVEGGVQMIGSFLQGISHNTSQLAAGAGEIIQTLANGVITLLPQLVQTAADLVMRFGQGLVQSLPELIPKGMEMVSGLIQSIVGNLDQMISVGIDVLVAFGQGLINSLPVLIAQIPRIVISICDAINNNASKLLLSAAKLLLQLGIGLIKAIPTLIQNIPVILQAIVKAFIAFNWLKLGGTLIKGIANGLKGASGFVSNEARNISNLMIRHMKELPKKLLQIGKDIVKNLANGIKAAGQWAISAIKNLGASMLSGITSIFSGGSAASKMKKDTEKNVSKSVGEGVHNGVKKGRREAEKSLTDQESTAIETAIGEGVAANVAKGISDGTKTAVKSAEDLSKEVLEAAESQLEDKRFYNQLSAAEEEAYWEELKTNAKLGAKELAEVDKKIYTARANASKELLDNTAKWVEKKKFYNNLSAKEELETWEKLLTNEELLAEEREQVERNLYTAKQTLAEDQKKLDEEYQKNLESRTAALKGFAGLFDQISDDSEITIEGMIGNLQGQVDAFAQWQRDMETLAGKSGMSDALMDELRELGPKSAGEIHALATASGGALDKFVKLFEEKSRLAKETAEKELGSIAVPIQFTNDAEAISGNMETVTAAAVTTVESLALGMEDTMFKISDVAEKIGQEFAQLITEQKPEYYAAGVMMIQGLWQGIASQRSGLINNIVQMLQAAVAAAKSAMDINSPSRVWDKEIGQQMAAGAGVGFVKRMRSVSRQMQQALNMETAKMSAQMNLTAEREAAQSTAKTITNHNDNGIVQHIAINQPVKSPADTARAIKRAGRELVRV